jgi:hypothetical protein
MNKRNEMKPERNEKWASEQYYMLPSSPLAINILYPGLTKNQACGLGRLQLARRKEEGRQWTMPLA